MYHRMMTCIHTYITHNLSQLLSFANAQFARAHRPGMSMVKYKEAVKREQDRLTSELEELNRKLTAQRFHIEDIEKKRIELGNKNKELYKILDVREFVIRHETHCCTSKYIIPYCSLTDIRKHRVMRSKRRGFWTN